VDLGQYVNPGTKLVTLQQLDPIFVDFFIPQKSVHDIVIGQKIVVRTDSQKQQVFTGAITAIDPSVDVSTRNVKIRAEVNNSKRQLLPGMFATVEINIGTTAAFITLPQTAISFNPYGNVVYLVEAQQPGPDGKPNLAVKQKFVTTGDSRGDQVAVLDGVKPGDEVVTSGQLKLRNGSAVVVNNSIQPTNNPTPTLKDEK
jgi:membrane fusion protein (multidrug efflux system)